MTDPLRIGILLDRLDVAAWEFSAIAQILALDGVEVVLVALNSQPPQPRGFGAVIRQNWHEAGYYLLDKLDRKLFSARPDAFALKNLQALLADFPTITTPIRQPDALAQIEAQQIDILTHFGAEQPHPALGQAARYGVWAYHHGDIRTPHSWPAGFWETAENRPVTGVALQILDRPSDPGSLLHQSWFPTYPFSPTMNRQLFLWTASTFMAREMARLHALGERRYFDAIHKQSPPIAIYDGKAYGPPHNIDVIKTASRLAYRIVARKLGDMLFREQWLLLYQFQDKLTLAPAQFKRISASPHRYWADPQVIEQDDRYAVFFEDYERQSDKGRIAVIQLDEAGNQSEPVVVLDEPYHLSYPFIFSWKDRLYMIPESAANRTIDLYECLEFPHKWRFKMHLMQDIRAADATLLHHSGKWWLFATVAAMPGISLNHELHLFFADDFASADWTPHPLNPIVTDVRRARPAGGILQLEDKLIRPAQNSARGYGRSITFNQIITLSETAYEERPIDVLQPGWEKSIIGVHTIQRVGRLTIIDALEKRARWDRRATTPAQVQS